MDMNMPKTDEKHEKTNKKNEKKVCSIESTIQSPTIKRTRKRTKE